MTDSPSLYFLSQAVGPHKLPEALEKSLRLDSNQRHWLSNLFLDSHDERQKLDKPMLVEKLFLVTQGAITADLAGSFLISDAADQVVLLCTPASGLERFDSRAKAQAELRARLLLPLQRDTLLRFVPLRTRAALGYEPPPTLLPRPLQGIVLEDRRQSVEDYLTETLRHLQDELLELPGFKMLLEQLLENTLGKRFPRVALKAMQVIDYASPTPSDASASLPRRQLSVRTLGETLLTRYNQGHWPSGQVREFVAPGYTAQAPDNSVWDNTLATLAEQLPSHLQNRLDSFWDAPLKIGQPRRDLFIDALGTRFLAELLRQERDLNEISPEDYPSLCGLYPLDRSRLDSITLHALDVLSGQGSYRLANAFVIHATGQQTTRYWLYAAERLQRFETRQPLLDSLKARMEAPDSDLSHGLSLRERAGLKLSGISAITMVPAELSIFEQLFKTIVAKQKDNVLYILERYRSSNATLALPAAFESALDIRDLITASLARLTVIPRWSHRLDLSPPPTPTPPPLLHTPAPTLATARHQLATLRQLKVQLTDGLGQRPSLKGFIRGELAAELTRAQLSHLSPDNLYINQYSSALPLTGDTTLLPSHSQSVIEHFFERVVRQGTRLVESLSTGLFSKAASGAWSRIGNLSINRLNSLIGNLLPDFLGQYLRRQRSTYGQLSTSLSDAISSGLQREAQFKQVHGALKDSDLALLKHLLGSHSRSQRPGLNGFLPDAYALTWQRDPASPRLKLYNCFMLSSHGGIGSEHCGALLLWTPAQGFEPFASFHEAQVELRRRLRDPVERLSLLENLGNNQHPGSLSDLPEPQDNPVGFELIQGGLLDNRFHSLVDKALADLHQAITVGYPSEQSDHHLQSCLNAHQTIPMLERAIEAAQHAATQLALPSWLAATDPSRQFALAALLDQYHQDAASTDDYHQGIADIRDTARQQLTKLLARDFPTANLDPDRITVWLTPLGAALPASESLTDLALRHVEDLPSQPIRLSLATGSLPAALDAQRALALIREADSGQQHSTLLAGHLAPDKPQNAHRRTMFSRHGYWQALLHAFVQRIGNTLSQKAHDFIRHLFAMPDGIARQPLDGQHIEIRPLQMRSGAQTAADTAQGLYLISPGADEPGPRILFRPQGDQPMFEEYTSEAAFTSALQNSTSLQRQVLERLPPGRQAHYTPQVFNTLQTRSDNPVRGNLFHRLYDDMTDLFKSMLGLQAVSGQGSLWEKALAWLKGELEQGASNLLGRLRLPSLVWQSLSQLKDAGEKAWQGRWSESIEEFVMLLAQLAMARRGWIRSDLGSATPLAPGQAIESPFPTPPWGDQRLTPGQKTLLLGLQAHRVALEHMTRGNTDNLYTEPTTSHTFMGIGGKVFQVRQEQKQPQEQKRWRIVTESAKGPWLRQQGQGQWVFDLPQRCIEGTHHDNA